MILVFGYLAVAVPFQHKIVPLVVLGSLLFLFIGFLAIQSAKAERLAESGFGQNAVCMRRGMEYP
jgi:hypothetical protein